MLRSMFAGVSALRAHQTMMDVVGNNIANVNTIGFKAGQVSFADLFNQTIKGATAPLAGRGGVNQQQIGLGSRVATILDIYTQGSLQVTGKGTDLAIQGDGFFILSDGSQNLYSRAGNFAFDQGGNLVNPANGYKVQGWVADNVGSINTNAAIEDIVIPLGTTISPRTTTEIVNTGNLDSRAWGANSTGSYNTSITVYDSLGDSHAIEITFSSGYVKGEKHFAPATGNTIDAYYPAGLNSVVITNADTGVLYTQGDNDGFVDPGEDYEVVGGVITNYAIPAGTSIKVDYKYTEPAVNTWNWVATVDGQEFDSTVVSPNNNGGWGTVTFNANGDFSSATPPGAGSLLINFDPAAANPVIISPNFTGFTQYASAGTAAATSQDGYTSGAVSGFTISDTGVVNGVFTNGVQRNLGQIALANFSNPTALYKAGDNMLTPSNNSGNPLVGVANTSGRGTLVSGSLEMSNVDLAKEFTNLIIAQRGFQANARVITTSDEVLTDLVGLKR